MESETRSGLIREGATLVDIYNDGLTVLLYDLANENQIREADPKIIWYAGREAFEDAATKELLAAGDLLVYGMHGDDGVYAEILVGEALTEAEMAGRNYLPPETGFLSLPSGNLCVHSFNTLPMGDNGDEPGTRALLRVPPGNYKVTLYRIDWMKPKDTDIEGEQDKEIIVLTPAEEIPAASNILFRDCIE